MHMGHAGGQGLRPIGCVFMRCPCQMEREHGAMAGLGRADNGNRHRLVARHQAGRVGLLLLKRGPEAPAWRICRQGGDIARLKPEPHERHRGVEARAAEHAGKALRNLIERQEIGNGLADHQNPVHSIPRRARWRIRWLAP